MRVSETIHAMATKHFVFYWSPVYAYAGLIFYMSSLPRVPPSQITATIADWIFHMIEYAVLSALLFRAFGKSENMVLKLGNTTPKSRAAVMAILVATVYGLTDEIHQYFVPGRVMSGFDAMANFLGCVVAVVAILIIRTKFKAKFKFSKLHL